MSTATLTPSSDNSVGASWSRTGGSSYAGAMSDGSDSTYGSVNSNAGSPGNQLVLNMSSLPGGVSAITSATGTVRCLKAQKTTDPIDLTLKNGSGTTLLSTTVFQPTQSISTITNSMTIADSTVADWTSLRLTVQST